MLTEADLILAQGGGKRTRQKFGNKKVRTEEGVFDSQREYAIWCELKLRQKAKEIYDLKRQVRFDLVVNGVKISFFKADFAWKEPMAFVVADCKSKPTRTRAYVMRKKLMLACHGIEILEMT